MIVYTNPDETAFVVREGDTLIGHVKLPVNHPETGKRTPDISGVEWGQPGSDMPANSPAKSGGWWVGFVSEPECNLHAPETWAKWQVNGLHSIVYDTNPNPIARWDRRGLTHGAPSARKKEPECSANP